MKILLIKVKSSSPAGVSCAPPLGLLYIASYLKKNRNGKDLISVFDMYVQKKTVDNIIEEFKPDVIGISAMTSEAEEMHKLCKKIKKTNNRITIVVGGPHPTGYLYETAKDENIDFIIPFEGEEPFLRLIEGLEAGKTDNIDGVLIKTNGSLYFKPIPPIDDLDTIPPPAYELIDLKAHTKFRSQTPFRITEPYALLFTSRGCPYKCIYCSTPFGKRYREHSAERVVSEINYLFSSLGVRNFLIADDIFNLNEKRMNMIFDLLISSNLNQKIKLFFTGGLRLDIIKSEETLYKMKQAGCRYLAFGFETSSERLQKLIKRNLKIQTVEKNLKILHKLGIYTSATFMFGLPYDTEEEMESTLNWALKNPITNATFLIANPLGGTELAEIRKERIKYKSFNDFGHFVTRVTVGDISTAKLYRFQLMAYIKFYSSPIRILRIVKQYPFNKIYLIGDFISFIKFLFRLIFVRIKK